MTWLGEKRKTEFSWTPAIQAMSESRIFEQNKHFLRKRIMPFSLSDEFLSRSSLTSRVEWMD